MRLATLLICTSLVLAGCLAGDAGDPSNATPTNATPDDRSPDRPENGSEPSDGSAGNASDGGDGNLSEGDVVGEGHIAQGSPTAWYRSVAVVTCHMTEAPCVEGVDSFLVDAPAAGTVIGTNTTDDVGQGFNLNLFFHSANGNYLGGCGEGPLDQTEAEQTCEVPEGAATAVVDAVWGTDLDVVVEVVQPP